MGLSQLRQVLEPEYLMNGWTRGYDSGGGSAAGAIVLLLVIFGLWALFGIAFGFGGRSIMRSKGRSGAAGFALGFFLGVVGLLIAALLSATPENEAERLRKQMMFMGAQAPPSPASAGFGGYDPTSPALRPSTPSAPPAALGAKNVLVLTAIVMGVSTVLQAAASWSGSFSTFRILTWISAVFGLAGAGAAAVVLTRLNNEPRAQALAWWQPAAIAGGALAGLFALLDPILLDSWTTAVYAQPLVFIAWSGVAAVALVRSQRTGALIAAGWVALAVGRAVLSKIRFLPGIDDNLSALSFLPGFSYSNSIMSILGLLASLGLGGLAVWSQTAAKTPKPVLAPSVAAGYAAQFSGPSTAVAPTTAAPAAAAGSPGWVADPFGRNEYRYWNGSAWTDQVANGGNVRTDPPTATPSPAPPVSMPPPVTPAPVAAQSFEDRWGPLDDGKTVITGSRRLPVELVFDTGQRAVLGNSLVVGRQPSPLPHLADAATFTYPDQTKLVSKNHFAIGHDAEGIWVEDTSSANGTVIANTAGDEQALTAGQRTRIAVGSTVRFGDQWMRIEQGR